MFEKNNVSAYSYLEQLLCSITFCWNILSDIKHYHSNQNIFILKSTDNIFIIFCFIYCVVKYERRIEYIQSEGKTMMGGKVGGVFIPVCCCFFLKENIFIHHSEA